MRFKSKVLVILFFLLSAGFLFGTEIASDYVYRFLSVEEKAVYKKIERAVSENEEYVYDVLPSSMANLKVLSAYMDDHPGTFWLEEKLAYMNDKNGHNCIRLYYTHTDSLELDKARFQLQTQLFHRYLEQDDNPWIKLYHIYDFLAKNIVYDNNYMDQSLWSVFFDGIGVCAGFARTFQYLALQEGIPCLIVKGREKDMQGNASPVLHAWVMALINNTWYQFDPTWGLIDSIGNVDFNYFCRSDASMMRTHVIETDYPLPDCPSDMFSYVRMRKRYLESFSVQGFSSIVKDAFEREEYAFTVEFSDSSSFNEALDFLIMNGGIFDIFKTLGYSVKQLLYVKNSQNLSLKISVSIK